MHKSTITTFVLLTSTLVMLSAMPLFNNNNSAMAQGYDNNYYGDSNSYSYSQYPTDDKKYECRTGPLEGFFVSSVEFCKHVKFDDDKDRNDHNRDSGTGPQGPAGSGNNNSTLVNTFNCINNNNININTDNNSSSSSGLQPIQDTIAQGLNGTLDGLSLNKTIVNLCFINDNDNNTIVDGGNETEPDLACEECFAANSTLQTAILDTIANLDEEDSSASRVSTVDGEGDIIAEVFIISPETDTIEKLCAQIKNSVENFGVPMSDTLLRVSFSFFLDAVAEGGPSQAAIDDLIECLLEKGIIVHRDLPPPLPIEICGNGMDDDGDDLVDSDDPDCSP
jgi:hypothetical protein